MTSLGLAFGKVEDRGWKELEGVEQKMERLAVGEDGKMIFQVKQGTLYPVLGRYKEMGTSEGDMW